MTIEVKVNLTEKIGRIDVEFEVAAYMGMMPITTQLTANEAETLIKKLRATVDRVRAHNNPPRPFWK